MSHGKDSKEPTTLSRRRRYSIDEDTGLLNLSSRKWRTDHVVVLREGLVIETDGTLWSADEYLAALKARPGVLLVAEAL